MSQLSKILIALGVTFLIAGLMIGGYFWWKKPDQKQPIEVSQQKDKTGGFSSQDNLEGPYYHQIYSATSTDGLNWTKKEKLIFDHASVPGAIVKDGKIYLYFVDAAEEKDQLSVAISTDNGQTFVEKQQVKIADSDPWDTVDPHPVLVDNKIRLYYLGNFSQLAEQTPPPPSTIYSAESSDGINFDNVQEAYKSTGSEVITDPDVFQTDKDWRMLISKGQNLELLISTDKGIIFTKQADFSWNKGGVCDTFNFDGLYRTFYCGEGLKSATGANQGKLTTESGTRIETENKIICDPSVVQLSDNSYIMFYKVQDATQKTQQPGKEMNPGQSPEGKQTLPQSTKP